MPCVTSKATLFQNDLTWWCFICVRDCSFTMLLKILLLLRESDADEPLFLLWLMASELELDCWAEGLGSAMICSFSLLVSSYNGLWLQRYIIRCWTFSKLDLASYCELNILGLHELYCGHQQNLWSELTAHERLMCWTAAWCCWTSGMLTRNTGSTEWIHRPALLKRERG